MKEKTMKAVDMGIKVQAVAFVALALFTLAQQPFAIPKDTTVIWLVLAFVWYGVSRKKPQKKLNEKPIIC